MDRLGAMMPATTAEQTGDVLTGIGASAGRVTAIARVLSGPADFAQLQPGEVLVASITTPAWTSLFARAGAVVTDIGGPLSHSSIVAREYGIPAVLGTAVATRRITNGQQITVDGDAGASHLTESDSESAAPAAVGQSRWVAGLVGAGVVAAGVCPDWSAGAAVGATTRADLSELRRVVSRRSPPRGRRPRTGCASARAPARSGARTRTDHAEAPGEHVHHGRRIEGGRQQQRYADQVDGDPDQPELDPAPSHPVGGQDRPGEDPGVRQRTPRAQRLEHEVEHRGHRTTAPPSSNEPPTGPPAHRGVRRPLRHPCDLLYCDQRDPPVHADDQEEHLSTGLTVEVEVGRGVENAARGRP